MQISCKSRVRRGFNVNSFQIFLLFNKHTILRNGHPNTHFFQLSDKAFQVFIKDIVDLNPFSNSCSKGDIGPCFDAIWNHLVTCPVEKVYSFNRNDICTCATNVSPHIIEEGHDVNNLRFTSSVFNNSTTFRFNSR